MPVIQIMQMPCSARRVQQRQHTGALGQKTHVPIFGAFTIANPSQSVLKDMGWEEIFSVVPFLLLFLHLSHYLFLNAPDGLNPSRAAASPSLMHSAA